MTSTITVNAHPVAPNNVVEVSVYDNEHGTNTQEHILQDGALATFHVSGSQSLSVHESFKVIVPAYSPPEPAQSTTG